MDRRNFLKKATATAITGIASIDMLNSQSFDTVSSLSGKDAGVYPRAITMWDFSWLERRWTGAGYEDWDKALDELAERGYNAVRIDAYPHLIATNPTKKWMLNEVWNQQTWGSPDMIEVQIQPYLNQFLEKCKARDIKVGLSSWYRQDTDNTVMTITSPEIMAGYWIKTLQSIEADGLLDTIMFTDMCNEWPGDSWAPYFAKEYPEVGWGNWYKEDSLKWMNTTLNIMKEKYPDMPFLFSFDHGDVSKYSKVDSSFLDLYEHHIWMAQQNGGEFYKEINYTYDRFSPQSYKNVVAGAEKLYRQKPGYWQGLLTTKIEQMAKVALENKRPVVTTECWGIVDYKDWPMLDWGWVKELSVLGTVTAAKTGAWIGIATSNFCGPQFVGMWRDVEWHRELTKIIRSSPVDKRITDNNPVVQKLIKRI